MNDEASRPRALPACVTTSRHPKEPEIARAHALAREWGLVYLPREGRSLAEIGEAARRLGIRDGAVVVVQADDIVLYVRGTCLRYHPGMGLSRLRRIMAGDGSDWMLRAMDLREGDSVLDATMGLASDLLVASFAVGERGRAVGVESEALIALIVKEGLAAYPHPEPRVVAAMRRIEVVHITYQEYLAALPDRSFDVVYFDPMFREPVLESDQMAPLRALANPMPLDPRGFQEALRVARRRVVVKDRREGPHATSGRFDRVIGGSKSRIAYCVKEIVPA